MRPCIGGGSSAAMWRFTTLSVILAFSAPACGLGSDLDGGASGVQFAARRREVVRPFSSDITVPTVSRGRIFKVVFASDLVEYQIVYLEYNKTE